MSAVIRAHLRAPRRNRALIAMHPTAGISSVSRLFRVARAPARPARSAWPATRPGAFLPSLARAPWAAALSLVIKAATSRATRSRRVSLARAGNVHR